MVFCLFKHIDSKNWHCKFPFAVAEILVGQSGWLGRPIHLRLTPIRWAIVGPWVRHPLWRLLWSWGRGGHEAGNDRRPQEYPGTEEFSVQGHVLWITQRDRRPNPDQGNIHGSLQEDAAICLRCGGRVVPMVSGHQGNVPPQFACLRGTTFLAFKRRLSSMPPDFSSQRTDWLRLLRQLRSSTFTPNCQRPCSRPAPTSCTHSWRLPKTSTTLPQSGRSLEKVQRSQKLHSDSGP